jgi:hypothetical protein
MPTAILRFIKQCAEFLPKDELKNIPPNTRGIYVLYEKHGAAFNVVYVGMARGEKTGMHSRLKRHAESKRKGSHWTHFSLFEVHDNVNVNEVEELEGLFRHIYRKDSRASFLNIQRGFKKLRKVRENNLKNWERC